MKHEKRVELASEHLSQADKDMGMTVRKANQLIQRNRFDMTIREQRLLLYCISRIKPKDTGAERYSINIRDVCAACGIVENVTGGAYNAMKEAVKKLDSFNFELIDDGGRRHIVHWIRSVVIDPEGKRRASIQFEFDPKIVPYLFDVRKYFTQYELSNVLKMKSVYGVRLYELAKSYQNIREKSFDLKELRYLLGAEEKSYDRYSNLKQKIIEPAMNELRMYSDLKIDYLEIKDGRKVTGIKFIISDGSGDKAMRDWEQIDRERHPERYQL